MSQPVAQTQRLEPTQVRNNAGGYSYQITDLQQVERFLILGTCSGTFYVKERELTQENINIISKAIKADGPTVVKLIQDIDVKGRAPKKSPALYALALCCAHGDENTKQMAYSIIPVVCRTASHLFEFLECCKSLKKGWGRGFKTAIQKWYTAKTDEKLSYQMAKYQQRNGFSHRDALRLAHPKSDSPVLRYYMKKEGTCPGILPFVETLKDMSVKDVAEKIASDRLPREIIPTTMLNDPQIWESLLMGMPLTALIRNLGKMTSIGLFDNTTNLTWVLAKLGDANYLKRSRIHPVQLLLALAVYRNGRGVKGALAWTPVPKITAALDQAFYKSFDFIPKSSKRIIAAVDASGSMTTGTEFPGLSCMQLGIAMAMVVAKMGDNNKVILFDAPGYTYGEGVELDVEGRRLDDILSQVRPGGGTDISIPFRLALRKNWNPDAVVIFTDSETWAGKTHPEQAMRELQAKNKECKIVNCAMVANRLSPTSIENTLQIAGFDASIPSLVGAYLGIEASADEDEE